MINGLKLTLKALDGSDTVPPWDMDQDTSTWGVVFGEDWQHGMCEMVGGGYMVSLDDGDSVEEFRGMVEALAWARARTGVNGAARA